MMTLSSPSPCGTTEQCAATSAPAGLHPGWQSRLTGATTSSNQNSEMTSKGVSGLPGTQLHVVAAHAWYLLAKRFQGCSQLRNSSSVMSSWFHGEITLIILGYLSWMLVRWLGQETSLAGSGDVTDHGHGSHEEPKHEVRRSDHTRNRVARSPWNRSLPASRPFTSDVIATAAFRDLR